MAVALALLWGSPAAAFREGPAGFGSGPGNVPGLIEAPGLKLTSEQKQRIGVLRQAHLKEIGPLQGRMLNKSRELRKLWLERTPNRERIMELHKEVQDIRNEMEDNLTGFRFEALQILTPEQRLKVDAYRSRRSPGPMTPPGMTPHGMKPPGMKPPGMGNRDLPGPGMR